MSLEPTSQSAAPRVPSEIDRICDAYVDECVANSPMLATSLGTAGYDDKWDDFSPAGIADGRARLVRFREQIAAAPVVDDVDRTTVDAIKESTDVELKLYDIGENERSLNNIDSPLQWMRDTFSGMRVGGAEAASNIISRLEGINGALEQYRESLLLARSRNQVAPIRQVKCVIDQAKDLTKDDSFYDVLVADALATPPAEGADDAAERAQLQERARQALTAAKAAYDEFAVFLETEIAPQAPAADACGRERYELLSQMFVGAKVDLDEAYEWGGEELARIDAQQQKIADELYGPGTPVREALERLDTEERYTLHGVDALQAWMQETADGAIRDLNGTQFDIPKPVQSIQCMIDKAGTGGIYYTGPSEDFSRPGRMWWSVPPGEDTFHTWQELTTVFHEGVPGHHLQIGITTANAAQLNKWRRLFYWNSGHGEGWALYAEDLMARLGYHQDLGTRMGMLDGQRLRAARVQLDIGVHLGKERPDGQGIWDGDYAWKFLQDNVAMAPGFLRFECDRYLGWPGQAPSYKLGQRIWEETRDEYLAKYADLDHDTALRQFHARALPLGALPMATLKRTVLAQ